MSRHHRRLSIHGKIRRHRRVGCGFQPDCCRGRARRQFMPPDTRRQGPDGHVRWLPERVCRAGCVLRISAADLAADRREGVPARHDGPAGSLRSDTVSEWRLRRFGGQSGLHAGLRHGKDRGMIRISIAASLVAVLAAGCVSSRPQPALQPEASPAKRIVRDGAQLVLPDGTRVSPDYTGGFTLPNGDYVKRERGALVLPTGARCQPDPSGYICP